MSQDKTDINDNASTNNATAESLVQMTIPNELEKMKQMLDASVKQSEQMIADSLKNTYDLINNANKQFSQASITSLANQALTPASQAEQENNQVAAHDAKTNDSNTHSVITPNDNSTAVLNHTSGQVESQEQSMPTMSPTSTTEESNQQLNETASLQNTVESALKSSAEQASSAINESIAQTENQLSEKISQFDFSHVTQQMQQSIDAVRQSIMQAESHLQAGAQTMTEQTVAEQASNPAEAAAPPPQTENQSPEVASTDSALGQTPAGGQ